MATLQAELEAAVQLIRDHAPQGTVVPDSRSLRSLANTDSLLDRCAAVVSQGNTGKPLLRMIHHFACSGGTLFSKCLSALPNTYVLSEAHPFSTLHVNPKRAAYLPSDITTLARYAKIPEVDELAQTLFVEGVKSTEAHVSKQGGALVLREHSHSDYCVGKEVARRRSAQSVLEEHFEILSLVTVRNPVDAYLSLKSNGWIHFAPGTFEEYCQRFLLFLEDYSDCHLIKYEDFVADPANVMDETAKILQLECDDSFLDTFDLFQVTGDSGRSGSAIKSRPRRPVDQDLAQEFRSSATFKVIAERLDYSEYGNG